MPAKKTETKKAVEPKEVIAAREKARIEAEEKEFEAMSDEDKAKNAGLMKRIRNKRASDQKQAELDNRVKAEKVFKVHLGDPKARPVLVKAKNKKAAIGKLKDKGAFQAFEVGEKYELPKAKAAEK